jgi:hypothetical protein
MRTTIRVPLLGAGFLLVAITCLATPATASDPDYKGWFTALDLAGTRPADLDQHFANRITGTTPATTVERLVIDNSTPVTWRADFGYGFGKGLGNLLVSYWSFDEDDSQREDPGTGYLYPTVFGSAAQGNIGALNVPLDASARVKARTYDLDYVRPMLYGDKLTLRWLAGLRYATYEENRDVEAIGSTVTYFQSKHIESHGTGIRFGLTAHFIFSGHFALDGGMTFSSLRSSAEAEALQIRDTFLDTLETRDDSVKGQMLDVGLRVVWSYAKLDYYVGYSSSTWDGLVADPLAGANGASSGPASTPADRTRDSISFDSVHAGIVWRFGKN